eukprot:4678584-Prorocentrum_lima.AAC.1
MPSPVWTGPPCTAHWSRKRAPWHLRRRAGTRSQPKVWRDNTGTAHVFSSTTGIDQGDPLATS